MSKSQADLGRNDQLKGVDHPSRNTEPGERRVRGYSQEDQGARRWQRRGARVSRDGSRTGAVLEVSGTACGVFVTEATED